MNSDARSVCVCALCTASLVYRLSCMYVCVMCVGCRAAKCREPPVHCVCDSCSKQWVILLYHGQTCVSLPVQGDWCPTPLWFQFVLVTLPFIVLTANTLSTWLQLQCCRSNSTTVCCPSNNHHVIIVTATTPTPTPFSFRVCCCGFPHSNSGWGVSGGLCYSVGRCT